MAGRKSKYSSAAERQAAYRARKSENVTPDVLRNCPSCGGELMDITDQKPNFDFMSFILMVDGRGYICKSCWKFTTVIAGGKPVTGDLMISLRKDAAHRQADS
jgi:hypothetical protein